MQAYLYAHSLKHKYVHWIGICSLHSVLLACYLTEKKNDKEDCLYANPGINNT